MRDMSNLTSTIGGISAAARLQHTEARAALKKTLHT
jgi:hypothetical protein